MVRVFTSRAPSGNVIVDDDDQIGEPFEEWCDLVTFRPCIAYLVCFARGIACDVFFKRFRMRVDFRAATIGIYQRYVPGASQDRFHRARLRLTDEWCLVCRRFICVSVIESFR